MRVLVTGGLGFIGRAVTLDLLAAGNEVVALKRGPENNVPPTPGLEVVAGDLRDDACIAQIVRGGSFDAVVHLGGLARPRESVSDPNDYDDVNVGGTRNVLRAFDESGNDSDPPVIVYASTTLVYGSRHLGAVDESAEPAPETPYAETKLAAERLITEHAESGASAGAILRIFNVGGAIAGVTDTDQSRIIPALLGAASGQRPDITLAGGGATVRDFVHVADVASAARAALERSRAGTCPVFNVGSGVGSSMIDVLHCVEDVTGTTISVQHTPETGVPGRLIANISRVRSELGWEPSRSDIRTIVSDSWASWPGRT